MYNSIIFIIMIAYTNVIACTNISHCHIFVKVVTLALSVSMRHDKLVDVT